MTGMHFEMKDVMWKDLIWHMRDSDKAKTIAQKIADHNGHDVFATKAFMVAAPVFL